MESRKASFVVDGLLNYFLFAPLTLIFRYGAGVLFEALVIDGETDPRQRAFVVLAVSTTFEIFVALEHHHLNQFSNEIYYVGYRQYFFLTRLHNYLMGLADVFLFLSIQTLYTEYVGDVEAEVHACYAAAVLAVSLALRVSRSRLSTPFVLDLNRQVEGRWYYFRLYFKTTLTSDFVLRLYDAIFSVLVVSLILDSYFYTLTFAFDGYIYPSDFVMAMLVSCAAGYVIVVLAKFMTPVALVASVQLERGGSALGKLVVEDGFIFAANFGNILLWKGLSMFAELLSEALGPVVGLSPRHMAIVNQFLAFAAMCLLGITSLLVFNGSVKDGELTSGQGLDFPTQYLNVEP